MDIAELNNIRNNCSRCGGDGVVPKLTKEGVFLKDCVCMSKITECAKLRRANIPIKYWDFGLENINANFNEKRKITGD